ncbi:hypothetical protein V8F33_003916 [Rhypophila sp. PSN 637]|uniref:Uncharacterized protein n=1 Tax=Rhypophila decipiens TaxID=261697 RepID=A0AAN7BA14_9PEZI|nr:hypothetical protein QBC37DRAFT_369113 [Rhypophila decipiens]
MCLIFTCGEHTFRKEVEGYEGIICRCYNCGNHRARVLKSNPWFTFCFIPVVPLSFRGYQDVTCEICNFAQPLEHRPDVQAMKRGAHGGPGIPLQHHGGPPPGAPGGPPPGWGGGGHPAKPNEPMRYG